MFREDYQVFLEELRKAVRRSGLNQTELAARLGRHRQYVSKVLRGEQTLTIIEIRDICNAAEISFIKLVTDLDERLKSTATTAPTET